MTIVGITVAIIGIIIFAMMIIANQFMVNGTCVVDNEAVTEGEPFTLASLLKMSEWGVIQTCQTMTNDEAFEIVYGHAWKVKVLCPVIKASLLYAQGELSPKVANTYYREYLRHKDGDIDPRVVDWFCYHIEDGDAICS